LIRAAGVSAADDRGLQERTAARLAAMKRSLADLSATGSSATGPGPGPAEGPHDCRRCELWRRATQAVAGSGPGDARVMLVGERVPKVSAPASCATRWLRISQEPAHCPRTRNK
jgi:hypothetical protein